MERDGPYVAQRLIGLMVRSWTEFHGEALRRGVYPLELPFAWLLDLIYVWATYGAKPEDKQRFDEELHKPPVDQEPAADDPVWGEDALMDQFMRTMQAAGSRGRKTAG